MFDGYILHLDTLEVKGVLDSVCRDFGAQPFTGWYWRRNQDRYYGAQYVFWLNENIVLSVNNGADKEAFKIRFGGSALVSLNDCREAFKSLKYKEVYYNLIDLAIDGQKEKIGLKSFNVRKLKEKNLVGNELKMIPGLDRKQKFMKGDQCTGYVWGDRKLLYVRYYDKIEELKRRPAKEKQDYIDALGYLDAWRLEFSVKGLFKNYKYEVNKDQMFDLGYLVNLTKGYIEKRLEWNKQANSIMKYLLTYKAEILDVKKVRKSHVIIEDYIQYKQSLGNMKSYILKLGLSVEDFNIIKSKIDKYLGDKLLKMEKKNGFSNSRSKKY